MRISGEHYLKIKAEIKRQMSERNDSAIKAADTSRKIIERAQARLKNIQRDYADGNMDIS